MHANNYEIIIKINYYTSPDCKYMNSIFYCRRNLRRTKVMFSVNQMNFQRMDSQQMHSQRMDSQRMDFPADGRSSSSFWINLWFPDLCYELVTSTVLKYFMIKSNNISVFYGITYNLYCPCIAVISFCCWRNRLQNMVSALIKCR